MGDNLPVGQWSPDVAVRSFVGQGKFPGKFFVTFTAGRGGKGGGGREVVGASKDVRLAKASSMRFASVALMRVRRSPRSSRAARVRRIRRACWSRGTFIPTMPTITIKAKETTDLGKLPIQEAK